MLSSSGRVDARQTVLYCAMGLVATVTRGHGGGKAMPQNRRRVRLVIIVCLLVLLGLGAGVVWFYFGYLTLSVATGTMADFGQKFVAAFVRTLADEHPRVHLKVVQMAETEARTKALAAGG